MQVIAWKITNGIGKEYTLNNNCVFLCSFDEISYLRYFYEIFLFLTNFEETFWHSFNKIPHNFSDKTSFVVIFGQNSCFFRIKFAFSWDLLMKLATFLLKINKIDFFGNHVEMCDYICDVLRLGARSIMASFPVYLLTTRWYIYETT